MQLKAERYRSRFTTVLTRLALRWWLDAPDALKARGDPRGCGQRVSGSEPPEIYHLGQELGREDHTHAGKTPHDLRLGIVGKQLFQTAVKLSDPLPGPEHLGDELRGERGLGLGGG
jgi:hypothetical protein